MRGRREDFVTSGSWRANRLSFSHLPLISDEIIIQGKEHVSAADQQQDSPNYQGDEQDNTVSVDSSSNASASTQQVLIFLWPLHQPVSLSIHQSSLSSSVSGFLSPLFIFSPFPTSAPFCTRARLCRNALQPEPAKVGDMSRTDGSGIENQGSAGLGCAPVFVCERSNPLTPCFFVRTL